MRIYNNPFEYDQAATIRPNFVRDVFIEDHNYTRFIRSNRNVFIVGERGSGKSMTLFYNSAAVQRLKAEEARETLDTAFLGVYVPCNTPLTQKPEYELLAPALAAMVSEHLMVLGIAHAIVKALTLLPDTAFLDQDKSIREEISYVLDADLIPGQPLLRALMSFFDRESQRSQTALNALQMDVFRSRAHTFASAVIPLLNTFRRSAPLANTHFMLLIDDAHDLNGYQKAALNSWIAYRERSSFSFKVAVADVYGYKYTTLTGGTILEGHDFLMIDLQRPFQSAGSEFGQLARDIVMRRLTTAGINQSADDFFPGGVDFLKDLERCRAEARAEANQRYPLDADAKKRSDYVYKYGRVKYFRERAARANLPSYSGFDTISHVSTGVIRNLLMPCYFMYDAVYSALPSDERSNVISNISPKIQSEVIRERSQQLWRWIETAMASTIDGCTLDDSKRIYSLLDNLGSLFKRRLMQAKSEPRAIAFSISGLTEEHAVHIEPLLHIARRSQLLYFRSGPSKDDGRREIYYVPNRMLWPIRGLDVVGQHARASLKAKDVWAAANGTPFPFADEGSTDDQGDLFDEEN